jgi:hypothetical protein
MNAYFGKQEMKDLKLAQVRAHRMADQIIKGKYWENGKGCAVGCTVHSSDHSAYEREMGIPRLLARLEDCLFERLPNERAMTWPEEFLEAIQIGADLSLVGARFMHWLLVDPKEGVIQHANTDQTREAIQKIAALYARKIGGSPVSINDWLVAAAAAAAAADAAADAVDAVAVAAVAVADAVAVAVANAVAVAADAADAVERARLRQFYGRYWWRHYYYRDLHRRSPVYTAKIVKQADKLLELLREVKS